MDWINHGCIEDLAVIGGGILAAAIGVMDQAWRRILALDGCPGQHKAIIDPELWRIVQDKLAANRQKRSLAVGAEAPSLLAGLIVDARRQSDDADPCHKESQAIPLLRLGVASRWGSLASPERDARSSG